GASRRRKFFGLLIAGSAVLVILSIGAFNYLVDPYAIFGVKSMAGPNTHKAEAGRDAPGVEGDCRHALWAECAHPRQFARRDWVRSPPSGVRRPPFARLQRGDPGKRDRLFSAGAAHVLRGIR